MQVHFTGTPPVGFVFPEGHEFTALKPGVPPFAVDALLVFAEDITTSLITEQLRRSGRPVFHLAPASAPEKAGELKAWLVRLADLPRTNYQPINCGFYDNFEAVILQRSTVRLEYRDAGGTNIRLLTQLDDLKTDRTEEYVLLASGAWLRLDQIVSVDGVAAGVSCRF